MAVLAINGGKPAITLPQDKALHWPVTDDAKTLKAVEELTRIGSLSGSKYTKLLEDGFKELVGCKYAIAVNNGTAAGHSCFYAIGLQPGDEVICPSFTFWASIMQAVHMGARPVFCDVDPDTLCLDPKDVAKRITKRTKAIVVVHMCGMMAEMDEIMRLARKHGIKVIEDCSHAHGGTYRGKQAGSFGDANFFSFQSSKLMVAGEGGIFVTDNKKYYQRAMFLGHYERLRSTNSFPDYSGVCAGFKYRIHPLAAAIAYHQLLKLPKMNERRNRSIRYFLENVRGLSTWCIPKEPKYIDRVYYCAWYHCNLEVLQGIGKEKFIKALNAEGCHVGDARYNLVHQNPIFRDAKTWGKGGLFPAFIGQKPVLYEKDALPLSEEMRQSLISFPTFPNASKALIDQYIRAFEKVDANLDELRA